MRIFTALLLALFVVCGCDDTADHHTGAPSILDSLNVTLEIAEGCLNQGTPVNITAQVTNKKSNAPVAGVSVELEAVIYWWVSCNQPGLSDWFNKKTGSGVTAANGSCQITIDGGTSDYPGATTQHVDVVRVTN